MAEANNSENSAGRSNRRDGRRRYFRGNPEAGEASSDKPEPGKVGGRTGAQRTSAQRNSAPGNRGQKQAAGGTQTGTAQSASPQSASPQSASPQSGGARSEASRSSSSRPGRKRTGAQRSNAPQASADSLPRSEREGTSRGASSRAGSSRGSASRGASSRGGASRGGTSRGGVSRGGVPNGGRASTENRQNPAEIDERRTRRRRRRGRDRVEVADTRFEGASTTGAVDYKAPQSVFVYTYVTRGDINERYESKVEHFSSLGRQIEDYAIDLSKLISEDGTIQLPKMNSKITDWEDEPAEKREDGSYQSSGV